eukprot:scaffold34451_cov60-Phaeocystis_antarctica.AAC.2
MSTEHRAPSTEHRAVSTEQVSKRAARREAQPTLPRRAAPLRGDLVFFQPPPRLREVADGRRVAAGQTVLDTGTLFVKRIVAVPGDTVSSDAIPNPDPNP